MIRNIISRIFSVLKAFANSKTSEERFILDNEWMMIIFSKLWNSKRVMNGLTGYELGSWLYDTRGDVPLHWWVSEKKNECSPVFIPDQSVLTGSVHIHPIGKSRYASMPKDTDFAKKYHPDKPMYIISRYGIYKYTSSLGDEKVMSIKTFRNWYINNDSKWNND